MIPYVGKIREVECLGATQWENAFSCESGKLDNGAEKNDKPK